MGIAEQGWTQALKTVFGLRDVVETPALGELQAPRRGRFRRPGGGAAAGLPPCRHPSAEKAGPYWLVCGFQIRLQAAGLGSARLAVTG